MTDRRQEDRPVAVDRRKPRETDKLECPYCHTLRSTVTNSRPGASSGSYWRRRKCASCGKRFTTEEVIRGTYPASS